MNGFSYHIGLNVITGSTLPGAISSLQRLDNLVDQAGGSAQQTANRLDQMGRRGSSSFDSMTSSARGWIASLGVGIGLMDVLNTTAKGESLEKNILFSSGSAEEGAKSLEFVKKTVQDLGLSLPASLEGFKTLSGSLMGTGLSADKARGIFHGVASAAGAMGMSADESKGAFLALGQMASKGKVQAEELRGQLGERLSGAFYQAAASMGMTTQQFDKALESGKVFSNDFLPGFAVQLENTFGQQARDNSNSATANFNRMGNSLYELKRVIGEEVMPTAIGLIRGFLIPAVHWIGQHIYWIGTLAVGLGTLWAVQKGYALIQGLVAAKTALATGATMLYTWWTGAQTVATEGATVATIGLNAAFWANPLAIFIGLALGAVAAVSYMWNKFDGFRAFLGGFWGTIKGVGMVIYDWLVKPLMAANKILLGLVTFDVGMMKEGMTSLAGSFNDPFKTIGDSIENSAVNAANSTFKIDPFGTAMPTLPGSGDAVTSAFIDKKLNGGGGGNGKPDNKLTDGINGVNEGGSKNIHIHVGSLIQGGFTIHTTNMKEGVAEMKALVQKEMLELMNIGNQGQR